MSFFLQVCSSLCCAFLLAFTAPGASASAGENSSLTARQQEILREFESFRPAWAEAGGRAWMLSVWDTDEGQSRLLSRLVALPEGAVSGGISGSVAAAENAARYFALLEEYYPSEKAALAGGGEDSAGVMALLEAADLAACAFSPEYYPEVTGADVRQPDFQVMREYLQALLRRGERAAARGDRGEAERCFRAALLCGRHLTSAKPSSVVFVTGIIFKVRGTQAFANYLVRVGDTARAAIAKEYAEYLAVLMRAFIWKANTALSEFDGFACLPAVVRVAREDAEAFWRKEAVIRLGTLRYGVPDAAGAVVLRNPALELFADEALEWVAGNDPDWTVRRMAVWAALNITPQNYAGMRQVF